MKFGQLYIWYFHLSVHYRDLAFFHFRLKVSMHMEKYKGVGIKNLTKVTKLFTIDIQQQMDTTTDIWKDKINVVNA